METKQAILSRGLPKTGQVEIYDSVDDGFYQAGWWQGQKEPRTRFVAKTIGANGDKVVIDLATGLMWAADITAKGCAYGATLVWLLTLAYPATIVFAGFNDWRMPNIFELFSIMDFSRNNPAINTDFFLSPNTGTFWSSTTYSGGITAAFYIDIAAGKIATKMKILSSYIRLVRGGV